MNQSEIVATRPRICRAVHLLAGKLFVCIQDHCDGHHHVFAKS